MTEKYYINNGWTFTENFTEEFLAGADEDSYETVRLPHTVKETPYNYFDPEIYQMVSGYRKVLDIPEGWAGKNISLVIEGAAQKAEVFLNGKKLSEHACGYTAFRTVLTEDLKTGENLLVIRLDSRETLDQPPFGKVIDYMTYGGIYREVYLEVSDNPCLADVFLMPELRSDLDYSAGKTTSTALLNSAVRVENPEGLPLSVRQRIRWKGSAGEDSTELVTGRMDLSAYERNLEGASVIGVELREVRLWDVEDPNLYEVTTELYEKREDGEYRLADRRTDITGFRRIEFRKEGFWLNGRKLKLRGLNRHQSYPYVGYAMPESMQELDADILKNELGLNCVRTSHYPCSKYFYDRCDEIGLLVFTEIPGWQNIGGKEWQDQAVRNTGDMIRQNRNHPSIMLWGVRINESADSEVFYDRTNQLARNLDPTRPTGGVRYLKKSSLREDVYTYNDFSYSGRTLPEGTKGRKGLDIWRACEPKRLVTSQEDKPYLITEYNGHMYPTKNYDSEDRRTEHALRHAAVLDSVAAQKDIAGSFGWCMFDYNTHKEFGSGDYICYHGVMDMYRNPKLAAAVYAAQQEERPVLEISSSMDKGEHPEGLLGRVYIITNADEVRFYRNGQYIRSYSQKDSTFQNLKHGPIEITDYVGDLVEKNENFSKEQAEDVKAVLNAYARCGMKGLPPAVLARAAVLLAKYKMTMDDAYALYGKYIGGWGSGSMTFRFEAVRGGKTVKTVVKEPVEKVFLTARTDHKHLKETTTYDVASVRVSVTDQNGNGLPFYFGSAELKTEGPIEVIGPRTLQLRGGCGGTYVKTTGSSGDAVLTIKPEGSQELRIRFHVEA